MSGVFPVQVSLSGCDATSVFTVNVTLDEYGLLEVLAAKSEESSDYVCQPVMSLKKLEESAS